MPDTTAPTMPATTSRFLADLDARARAAGLALRGAFHPVAADGVPPFADGEPVATLVLLGFTGTRQWPAFAAAPERHDGLAHPLDRWSRRIIDALGVAIAARPLYPFAGPPWLPFQRWARRAEPVYSSPLGILIHPEFGLWHAYRGALALRVALELPRREQTQSPCQTCVAKPCLSACPVAAIRPQHFNAEACAGHVGSPSGDDCRGYGCRARRACPVGAQHRYGADHAQFHMLAFLAAQARADS